jgi:hypothetical protein
MADPSWKDIEKDFNESLGYLRQDIRQLLKLDCKPNYTVAILIGSGCEMLAAGRGLKKSGETALALLLPPDWRLLAKRIYTALRDRLVHGFDTKFLDVSGQKVPIYVSWGLSQRIEMRSNGAELWVGVQPLATALCQEIDNFENDLRQNAAARALFREAFDHDRSTPLTSDELAASKKLAAAPHPRSATPRAP